MKERDARARGRCLAARDAEAIRSRIPTIPIYAALGFHDIVLHPGGCRATVPRRPELDGIFRTFHGGLLMTVADSAAALAVLTAVGADAEITTTDMGIRFLAPCRSEVTVDARVLKVGRTLIPVAVDLFDADGVRVSVAQVTYMRLAS